MRRQPWSDRISAAAIAVCFHVLAILFLGLVSPTLHTPPRLLDLAPEEPVIEVELTRPPLPLPVPKPAPQRTVTARAEPAPQATPQVLARPPTPSPTPDPAAVVQPAPRPEAQTKPKPIPAPPAPPAPTVEAKAQVLEPPKPAEPPKAREKEKEKEKDKPPTQLAVTPKAEAPAQVPTPPPASRPTASSAPQVPVPGFRLPPGYGRQVETDSGGGLRGVLRATVGCAHESYVALTAAEKERCARAFVRDASRGVQVDPVPSDKREAYDVEAAANARRRAAKEGALAAPVVPCDGPGSNLGGGCLPEEAHTHIRPK